MKRGDVPTRGDVVRVHDPSQTAFEQGTLSPVHACSHFTFTFSHVFDVNALPKQIIKKNLPIKHCQIAIVNH